MSVPSVSLIIPAHNAAGTLRACLASVADSNYAGVLETIVVDDGSSDETADIAREMGVRLIRRNQAGGPAVARNVGARAARHELLMFVDSDTELLPDTIANGVHALVESGDAAVCGVYSREPVNEGFFPRYYAYLKRHAFESSPAEEISAFGAQCAVVSRQVFREVGGFRAIGWGMDVENDELGERISRRGRIGLCRTFEVRHNFPTFRKLLYIFTSRVYWWVIFSFFQKRRERVLMTRGFGLGTASLPAAVPFLVLAGLAQTVPAAFYLNIIGAALLTGFVTTYSPFWWFCVRHRGPLFGVAAALASMAFAVVITAGAARGYVSALWMRARRREPAFAGAALGYA